MVEPIVECSTETVLNVAKAEAMRVLHVDDDLTFLSISKQCLEMQGEIEVDAVSSVNEASEKLKKTDYDAIVCDYQMPGKDGLEFLRELRANGNNTPFIVFTGRGREEIAMKALNLGAEGYFSKHGEPETVYGELAHGIRQVVESERAADALRESESKAKTLLENVPQKIFFKDRNSVYISCNENYARDLRIKANEIEGRTDFDFYPKKLAEKYRTDDKRIMETGNIENIEEEYVQDKQKGYVNTVKTPVKDEKGNVIGLLGIFWDITERKKAEEELRESEERFRNIVESSQDVIMLTQPDGIVSYLSPACSKVLGYEPAELVGKQPWIFHPDDLERVKAAHCDALKGRKGSNLEYRVITKTGETRLVSHSWSPLIADNKVKLIVSVVREITERKKAEEAVLAERDRLETVTRSIGAGLAIISKDYRTLWANDVLKQMFGDVEGKICYSTYNQRNGICPKCGVQEILETGKAQVVHEQVGKDADGKTVWSEITATPVKDRDGNITAVLELVVPITQRKRAEDELRDSEEKYRSLFANMLNGFAYCKMIFDGKGKPVDFVYLDVNDAFEKLTGLRKKNVVGKKVTEAIPGTEIAHPELFDIYGRVASTGKEKRFELFFKPLDMWLSISVYSPKKGYFVAVFENITERKKAEEELRNSEEKYRRIFESVNDVVLYVDKTGRIVDINERVKDVSGYDRNELVGKNVFTSRFISLRQLPKLIRSFKSSVGKGAVDSTQKMANIMEVEIRHKKGHMVQTEASTQIVEREGHTEGFLSVLRDITERKKTERLVYESRQRFEGLFVGNPEAAAYLDPDFRIRDINPRFEELFGYSPADVQGKRINDVVVPDDRRKEGEALDKDARKGYVYRNTVRRKKDGSLVQVSVSTAPMTSEKGIVGIVAMYKDVSDLKNAEKELDSMIEKLRVVGSLTRHDVRNKLTAVNGNAYLLKKRFASDPDALECLRSVETAVRESERIFDFAGAYEKLGVEQLVYVDVKKTVDEAAGLLPDLKGVKMTNDCGGLTLLGDSLLRQLFYNLIDNSLKYGEKLTRIRIHYEKSEDQLKLVYEDDGVGISRDAKARLFTEGFTTGKGSGYGLYLIGRMMEVYGWTINETGAPSKGAKFVMTIPKTNPNGKENYVVGR